MSPSEVLLSTENPLERGKWKSQQEENIKVTEVMGIFTTFCNIGENSTPGRPLKGTVKQVMNSNLVIYKKKKEFREEEGACEKPRRDTHFSGNTSTFERTVLWDNPSVSCEYLLLSLTDNKSCFGLLQGRI